MMRKNAFAHFHGKLAKLKTFHAKCHLFYFILMFLIAKKITTNLANKICRKKIKNKKINKFKQNIF